MCGIAGIWSKDGSHFSEHSLRKLTNALAHRGPDGNGIFIDKHASFGLGHRRLSILDLGESGKQPMSYGSGRYRITFNGEIYNFIELRQDLEKLGHRFFSDSDTEVILAAYAQWGEDCQHRFNGMWAFAIWDSEERLLFLSRDRFGVKPLFFLNTDNYFIFASELKAFMALPRSFRPDIDETMVARMKNDESIDETLLKGVSNLNGGCCLRLSSEGTPRLRRWWETADHLFDPPGKFEEQVELYREIFMDSCRLRMRSDVPIGVALSGGLDSSSVSCSMSEIRKVPSTKQRFANNWQQSFVLVYENTDQNEEEFARRVIQHTGNTPRFRYINPEIITEKEIRQSILSFEAIQNAEPSLGPWLIYEEMKNRGVRVSLDGIGGDEALGGYLEYLPVALKDAVWPVPRPARWRDLQCVLAGMMGNEDLENKRNSHVTVFDVIQSMVPNFSGKKEQVIGALENYPWLRKNIRRAYRGTKKSFGIGDSSVQGGWIKIEPARPRSRFRTNVPGSWSFLKNYQYNDFHYGTNARILRNFDRMSMGHGVESRAPFMDWRLVCLSFSLPSESKIGSGYTKRILREAMKGVLPDRIRVRKGKVGFSSPLAAWYRYGLNDLVIDTLNSQDFLTSDIWNGHRIREYTETSLRKGNYDDAVRSWKFIQAHFLMDEFGRLSTEGEDP